MFPIIIPQYLLYLGTGFTGGMSFLSPNQECQSTVGTKNENVN